MNRYSSRAAVSFVLIGMIVLPGFRGYARLHLYDGDDKYITIFSDNMDHLWEHVRNKDGLFSKDWKGEKEDQYKALLDQTGIAEIFATLGIRNDFKNRQHNP